MSACHRKVQLLSAVYSLLYVSRGLVAPDGGSPPAAVREIVDRSIRYNGQHAITGALIWTPHYFAQILEGDRSAVHLLYDKIVLDTRHEEVWLADSCDTPERAFPDWSLAYSGGTSYVQERLARMHAERSGKADQSDVTMLRRLISELVSAGGVSH